LHNEREHLTNGISEKERSGVRENMVSGEVGNQRDKNRE
jgi:hypothetical protein